MVTLCFVCRYLPSQSTPSNTSFTLSSIWSAEDIGANSNDIQTAILIKYFITGNAINKCRLV